MIEKKPLTNHWVDPGPFLSDQGLKVTTQTSDKHSRLFLDFPGQKLQFSPLTFKRL